VRHLVTAALFVLLASRARAQGTGGPDYYPPAGGSGSGGASTSADNSWTGTQSFLDTKWLLKDDADATKLLSFQLSGITTGTTRTLTVPNISGTIAVPESPFSNNWAGQQNMANLLLLGNAVPMWFGGDLASGIMSYDTAQVPSSVVFKMSGNNGFIFGARANTGSYAHAAQTNPTLFLHSVNQSTTQWLSMAHDGTSGVLQTGAGNLNLNSAGLTTVLNANSGYSLLNFGNGYAYLERNDNPSAVRFTLGNGYAAVGASLILAAPGPRLLILPATTALADAAATNAVSLTLATNSGSGGVLIYTITANSGGSWQSRSGSIPFAAINQSNVATCTLGTASDVMAGSGTLTVTFTCDASPGTSVILRANADTSLNVAPAIQMQLLLNGPTNFNQYF
jgi:hypothetical protein